MVAFTDAKEVSAEIVKQFNLLLVTLFCSVARKTSGNDLDILVVVEDRDDYQGEKQILSCNALWQNITTDSISPLSSCRFQNILTNYVLMSLSSIQSSKKGKFST